MKLFLLPGDLICDAVGLPRESDDRQVLRSFVNTIFWDGRSPGSVALN
jgi:hypothetical protein